MLQFMGSQRVDTTEQLNGTELHLLKLFMLTMCAQSCPIFCDPMNYNPPDSSVHEILQAKILAWVAISFSIHVD